MWFKLFRLQTNQIKNESEIFQKHFVGDGAYGNLGKAFSADLADGNDNASGLADFLYKTEGKCIKTID